VSALGLVVTLALAGGDVLSVVNLRGLGFKAPTGWEKGAPDENSVEWTAPNEAAKMAVSAYPLEKFQPPAGCMKKMLDAVGREGFDPLTLGAQPAARKVTSDYLGQGEEAKVEANRITTTMVIGCNGRVKWVLTWASKTADAPRFGPMLKRILDSVSYGKAP